ncbi:MAG: deoxyribose-phosphate aldolase [Ancalomicrobiaceae bacterium]|nr:deoxyribose-phosphate aldolase [Ancalomicrobiaceae bacterium]
MTSLATVAERALPLVDLTDLTDSCSEAAVAELCRRAVTPHGSVAAICIYPRFVAFAKPLLAGTGVKIATVVNFPAGGTDTDAVVKETEAVVAAGADEVDLVMPYQAFADGYHATAEDQIRRVKAAAIPARLKVILETGKLVAPELIRAAADLALACGADFIKTSTGKVEVNATPEAARIMLEAIKASGSTAGFKAAGGVRTTAEAAQYLKLADEILGERWVGPNTFRFGASGLLGDLIASIEGTAAAKPAAAY